MTNAGKKNILGVLIDVVDYEGVVKHVLEAAREGRGMTVSAIAVHGIMTGVLSAEQKYRLNHFDLLAPDGQPVRWALNLLHGAMLRDRVYGPKLMLNVCEHAEREGLGVYLYGSTQEILAGLKTNLVARFPRLMIRGTAPSKFRPLSSREKDDVALQIRSSGARMIFVGLGCPRQEVWAYEFGEGLSMPIVAVGAAFAFLAGRLRQAPDWMQERGLEWLFRLGAEPKRLWRRYLLLNPAYILLVALQAMGLARFATDGQQPSKELLYG